MFESIVGYLLTPGIIAISLKQHILLLFSNFETEFNTNSLLLYRFHTKRDKTTVADHETGCKN
jgi:hypothetical protein